MPIDTGSEEWRNARLEDWTEVFLLQFFDQNPDCAFTVKEIAERLAEETPEVFPQTIRGDESLQISYIAAGLDRMDWKSQVEMRTIEKEGMVESYYSKKEGASYPMAQIEDEFPRRLDSLEEKLEDEGEGLEDRVDSLEYRVYELENDW
ncbi:hypothetical protein [Halomarina rubra]|uniref:Uncharacterized protein n=1 Tax=Halomarina rubra TaxID=2071873 RepID=A0ABD6AT89_9EURY|nr:hypothetical protein [Halomarina rubra]